MGSASRIFTALFDEIIRRKAGVLRSWQQDPDIQESSRCLAFGPVESVEEIEKASKYRDHPISCFGVDSCDLAVKLVG